MSWISFKKQEDGSHKFNDGVLSITYDDTGKMTATRNGEEVYIHQYADNVTAMLAAAKVYEKLKKTK